MFNYEKWREVIKYIYFSTVLNYTSEVVVL